MKTQREKLPVGAKKKYVKPNLEAIAIDHAISLVMMSESSEPPPEFISVMNKTFKWG